MIYHSQQYKIDHLKNIVSGDQVHGCCSYMCGGREQLCGVDFSPSTFARHLGIELWSSGLRNKYFTYQAIAWALKSVIFNLLFQNILE